MKKHLYLLFTIKRYIEQLVMFPFILIGKLYAILNPLHEQYDYFFFFPVYSIGGAERVNAEIVHAMNDRKIIIFFTKRSHNDGMLHFYQRPNVHIREIGKYADNKFLYFLNLIWRGIISQYINTQAEKPTVFIGQCNFGYKLCPHINRRIKITELIHVHELKFLWVWAPFIRFIDTRVVIGDVFIKTFRQVHAEYGIPLKYIDNYKVIRYCLEYLPDTLIQKNFQLPLRIYYAGRGGHQKRLWVLFRIIRKCNERGLPLHFSLAGPFQHELPADLGENVSYYGELKGGEAMYNFHKKNDILLMTSAFEGFPIVMLEAMSFGSPVIAPAVDAIPENIVHKQNGFIIQEHINEDKMVEEAVLIIESILAEKNHLAEISYNAYNTVKHKFSKENFVRAYRELLI
jgi:L-malate glycosyltransferase